MTYDLPKPFRAWINAPSTNSDLHRLHGTNVLAIVEGICSVRIYFLEGSIESMSVPNNVLSTGWKGLSTPKPQCLADMHREIMVKHFGNEGSELDYKYVSWVFTSDDLVESTTGLWLLDNESGYREHSKIYYAAKRDLMRAELTLLDLEYANSNLKQCKETHHPHGW